MDISDFYSRMRREVSGYSGAGRSDTAAFLVWFLINYFRIEAQDAIDAVCDHTNDKGIDGIYTDDEEEVIYLFQSKFSPSDNQDQGDNDIRNFMGTIRWFENDRRVQELLDSTANNELKSLVERTAIIKKTHFILKLVFVTNKHFNTHANEYISGASRLEAYDANKLFEEYTYFADEEVSTPEIELALPNPSHIDYTVPDNISVRVYAIKATELVKLDGIQDRTLFLKNVRYGVGATRVNKSLKATISDRSQHFNFFLYHNGITIVCGHMEPQENSLKIANYAVVNGCQSMLSFYENRDKLSNNLYVLTKIINLDISSPLVRDITYYANNQNAIGVADLRANDAVQRALQREFRELFGDEVVYIRKRGESAEGYGYAIEKDLAAQLVEAVYYGKPHNTHLKQKLFGEEYTTIFSRRLNAEKIFLAYMLYDTVINHSELLDNQQIRTYGLAHFYFAQALAEVLRKEELGNRILDNPRDFVTAQREILQGAIMRTWQMLTPDINADIDEYTASQGGFFDYKNVFKNATFVEHMNRRIRADYERLVRRNSSDSFTDIFVGLSSARSRQEL